MHEAHFPDGHVEKTLIAEASDEELIQELKRRHGDALDRGAAEVRQKKVGRNDPCPCKSGRKFKKCCQWKVVAGMGRERLTSSKTASVCEEDEDFLYRVKNVEVCIEGAEYVEYDHLKCVVIVRRPASAEEIREFGGEGDDDDDAKT